MSQLTHIDGAGRPRMVDVSDKEVTDRVAVAEGRITMGAETLEALATGGGPKGDVLTVARIAGIQAAKRTADLIPLCHPLPLTRVDVTLETEERPTALRATATARTRGRTGVEMEALTAVSVALLTVYDMAKAMDRGMTIEGIRLVEKSGGRSGHWTAERPALEASPAPAAESTP